MLWVKALHVISIITWMAGLFYLPRLFVYHAQTESGSATSETFKVMERKLLRFITTPAMISSWIFGLWYATWAGTWDQPWFHAKLLLVVLLSGYHGMLAKWTRVFAEDRNSRSHVFYRYMNEVPTVLMIIIIILVIVRPF